MATEYGSRLREARRRAKLTQVDLSKKTGIPQSTISTAERLGNGSAETAVYAKVCGVDAHWLATGEGAMVQATEAAPDAQPAVSALENDLLYNFRSLTDDDQAELFAEIERRAVKTRAHVEKVLKSMRDRAT